MNERLTWMSSELTDIGIDLSFFKHKLAVTFDWYQKNRSGLLAYRSVSLPSTYGGTFPQENLNKDRVRGFDFSIDYKNSIGEVNYKIAGNFNYARTKNVYVEQSEFGNSWDTYRNNQIGRNQGIVWTYNVIGRFQSEEEVLAGTIHNETHGNRYVLPGDFICEDVSGDGYINENDMRPHFYDTNPKMNYGLSLSASWKGFDASMFFQGSALFSKRTAISYGMMFWGNGNLPAFFMDRWHREDPYDPESKWIPGEWPAMRPDYNKYTQLFFMYRDNDIWRRSCSFVRLKNINAGYTLPQRFSRKAGLDNVRIFVNISNLYTWANAFIKPFDPEKVAGNLDAGWTYPVMKTWNIGLDINF